MLALAAVTATSSVGCRRDLLGAGASLYGDSYWQAKRCYGQNVVLPWIGSTP